MFTSMQYTLTLLVKFFYILIEYDYYINCCGNCSAEDKEKHMGVIEISKELLKNKFPRADLIDNCAFLSDQTLEKKANTATMDMLDHFPSDKLEHQYKDHYSDFTHYNKFNQNPSPEINIYEPKKDLMSLNVEADGPGTYYKTLGSKNNISGHTTIFSIREVEEATPRDNLIKESRSSTNKEKYKCDEMQTTSNDKPLKEENIEKSYASFENAISDVFEENQGILSSEYNKIEKSSIIEDNSAFDDDLSQKKQRKPNTSSTDVSEKKVTNNNTAERLKKRKNTSSDFHLRKSIPNFDLIFDLECDLNLSPGLYNENNKTLKAGISSEKNQHVQNSLISPSEIENILVDFEFLPSTKEADILINTIILNQINIIKFDVSKPKKDNIIFALSNIKHSVFIPNMHMYISIKPGSSQDGSLLLNLEFPEIPVFLCLEFYNQTHGCTFSLPKYTRQLTQFHQMASIDVHVLPQNNIKLIEILPKFKFISHCNLFYSTHYTKSIYNLRYNSELKNLSSEYNSNYKSACQSNVNKKTLSSVRQCKTRISKIFKELNKIRFYNSTIEKSTTDDSMSEIVSKLRKLESHLKEMSDTPFRLCNLKHEIEQILKFQKEFIYNGEWLSFLHVLNADEMSLINAYAKVYRFFKKALVSIERLYNIYLRGLCFWSYN
ncbi:hypothetical protein CDIK_2651 [Cucumispora dikerogammari]|nr:hypothetical protein CDIK_2651 [Cucumispora dikerogammari]